MLWCYVQLVGLGTCVSTVGVANARAPLDVFKEEILVIYCCVREDRCKAE